jgi:hypothetical protein
VIAVEGREGAAVPIEQLVDLHREKAISLGITTVSASENLQGSKVFPASAKQFKSRIHALGWDDLELVLGPQIIGLTYIGLSKLTNSQFAAEIEAIWAAMFPRVDRNLPKGVTDEELHSRHFKKWRGAWCDVHTVWTHIDAGRDVLVTSDIDDVHKHREKLQALGLKHVFTPQEALCHFREARPIR